MKKFIVLVMCLAMTVPLTAQQKAVHFKKLQAFLPTKAPAEFTRQKPTGQTQSALGMTTSEAKVTLTRSAKDSVKNDETGEMEERSVTITLEVTISDVSLIPFAAAAYMMQTGDFENETEEGYEKSITVKNFRGKETVTNTPDNKRCGIELFVGNRFLVKLQGESTSDVKLLYALLDQIDLAKLEKEQP